MKDKWEKIENWVAENFPAMLKTLNKGATGEDFIKLETVIGKKLPADFIEFYSIHNGQIWTNLNLFDTDRLLSVEEIIRSWEMWKSVMPEINDTCLKSYGSVPESTPDMGIKNDWWNVSWIPITEDGCGDSYCIDLDPATEGNYGQIIRMRHHMSDRELIAASFRNWIENYINDLEQGIYTISNDTGWGSGIVKKEL